MNIKEELNLTLKLNQDLFYLIFKILKLKFIKESFFKESRYGYIEEPKIINDEFYINDIHINKENYLNIDVCKELIKDFNDINNKCLKINSYKEYLNFYPKLLNDFYSKIKIYYNETFYINSKYITSNINFISDNLKDFFEQQNLLNKLNYAKPTKYLFTDNEENEDLINNYYLIKEKLKYNIENFLLDRELMKDVDYIIGYDGLFFPNKNYK